jgi:hypothetical protein
VRERGIPVVVVDQDGSGALRPSGLGQRDPATSSPAGTSTFGSRFWTVGPTGRAADLGQPVAPPLVQDGANQVERSTPSSRSGSDPEPIRELDPVQSGDS